MPRGEKRSPQMLIEELMESKVELQSKIEKLQEKIAEVDTQIEVIKESVKQAELQSLMDEIKAMGKTPKEILDLLKANETVAEPEEKVAV